MKEIHHVLRDKCMFAVTVRLQINSRTRRFKPEQYTHPTTSTYSELNLIIIMNKFIYAKFIQIKLLFFPKMDSEIFNFHFSC